MFRIQASNPKINSNGAMEIEDISDLSDLIESAYILNTEDMIMFWNYIPIVVSYKYNLSELIDDILEMLFQLRTKEEGTLTIEWPSSSFHGVWNMSWQGNDCLTIDSEWTSVVGGTKKLLNDDSRIELSKKGFVAEWKKVLENIINGLREINKNNLLNSAIQKIEIEYKKIEKYGELYQT